jgi:hypothetical protein
MTEGCITPLRRRMIKDMSVRHFTSKAQHGYIRTVMKLTRYLGRSPDAATRPSQKSAGLSGSWLSGQYRNSPSQIVGGYASLAKKNRSISREASGPC